MTTENNINFPKLADCTYLERGFCGTNGCYLQALMNISINAGNNAGATKARDKMEKEAKFKGCKEKIVRPKFN